MKALRVASAVKSTTLTAPMSIDVPMTTLVGVPILHGARPLGNLYLTDRADGRPFVFPVASAACND